MKKFILPVGSVVFFWGIFALVILYIPYPESLTQANWTQITPFFIFLYLTLVFALNIFLKNIFISSSIALGLIFLLTLKALDSLNLVTGVLTIIAVGLLISYFRKVKRHDPPPSSGFKNLTKLPKIPKLTSLRRNKA